MVKFKNAKLFKAQIVLNSFNREFGIINDVLEREPFVRDFIK